VKYGIGTLAGALTIKYQSSDATTAQAVDVSGMQTAEILAALCAVIQIGFKAGIALALAVYEVVAGMQGLGDIVGIPHMGADLLPAQVPVFIPTGSLTAMFTDRAVSPHAHFSLTTL
jgi:hypothetical protein